MDILSLVIPLVIIFGIFWFLIIKPQKKQQQKHEKMLENLEVGDKIVTIGGIKGKVVKIKDDIIRLKISSDTDINVINRAVSRLDKSEMEEEEDEQ